MNIDQAIEIANQLVFQKNNRSLSDAEETVLRGALEGITYDEIAESSPYSSNYLQRYVGPKFWKLLSDILEQKVSKSSFRAALESKWQRSSESTLLEENYQTSTLAQQMKGWFKTLEYDFENYEKFGKNYFEWIIHIPTRRGFERILVRGIKGEVEISDVKVLLRSMDKQNTDEGWLVTSRRKSPTAETKIKEESNIFCYTFDELLDEVADFSSYLEWLETEVKERQIEELYVPLACRKEEFDPNTKESLGLSSYQEEQGWIDGYIDLWLDDEVKEHISILGEFGTGKTWFAFNYAWTALKRYQDAKQRGVERPRLPLLIPLRDYAKALDVENVLAGFFFSKHNIRINSKVFEQLNRMGKLLLIFDGFDEMAAKVDRQQMINNFWELAKVVVPGAKVILTCRTEHFPEAQAGRRLLNAELKASTAKLTGETPQFEVLELEKFNDKQIRKVLEKRAKPATVEQVIKNSQLLDLARRPLMIELILDALPDIEVGKPIDLARVYLYAVWQKMDRDIKMERTFTSLADKLYFLCEVAWEMLSTNQMSLNYRSFPDRIRRLFSKVVQEQKDLDHWHYDMMGQTMLIRNPDGDYTPAHRSLLEFFVAYKFAAELGVLASDFIKLAQEQSHSDKSLRSKTYTWSNYFQRELDKKGEVVSIPPLQDFSCESWEHLLQNIGREKLTKAIIDLIAPMIVDDTSTMTEQLLKIVKETRDKKEEEVDYIGGNVITLLLEKDPSILKDEDLSRTVVKGADFTNASLHNVDFTYANLNDSIFAEPSSSILSVAFHPNGELLAAGDGNGKISLLLVQNRQKIITFQGHNNRVRALNFSPDGKILASGSEDNTLKLWNVDIVGDVDNEECQSLKTFEGHNSRVWTVDFSPDGKILASGSEDNTIKLWDLETKQCLKTFKGHEEWVRSVAFSPDGKILASSGDDNYIKLWDAYTGKKLDLFKGHQGRVWTVAFSPDGKILASSGDDNKIIIWDLDSKKLLRTLEGHTNWVMSVTFSPDGKTLASGSEDKTVKLWDVKTGKLRQTLSEHTNRICSVVFSPDGQTLASSSDDQTVRFWDIKKDTVEYRGNWQGYANRVWSVAFSPDGKSIASGSDDNKIRIWNVNTGQCVQTLPKYKSEGHKSQIWSVAFSPDGQKIASGSNDHTIKLWNVNTGECLTTLRGHTNWVWSITFNRDGKTLASASDDCTVRLWNIEKNKYRIIGQNKLDRVRSVVFSSDGRTLASGSDDTTIKLWDVDTGTLRQTFKGHRNRVWCVTFSSDDQTLASGSDDTTVKLWNIDTGQCLQTFEGHKSSVWTVAFSSNGQTLASGSDDNKIRLWDLKKGECREILDGHKDKVRSLNFSPNSTMLVSSGEDAKIILWDVKNGNYLKTLEAEKPYERMKIKNVTGLTKNQKVSLNALGAKEDY